MGESTVHSYAPSCKLLSTLLADSWLVKPLFFTVKPPANRSTLLPFSVQDTDETGGLAQISHCRTSTASSSSVTSSDPESSGASEEEHYRGNINAAEICFNNSETKLHRFNLKKRFDCSYFATFT